MYAEVLIEYNSKSVDKTFTYIIPKNLNIKIGMKVLIPFGNKKINGFVVKIKDNYDDSYELKEIVDIVDENFILNEELMKLGEYLQYKTLCTKIAAYQAMLPSSLKVKEQKSNYNKYITYVELNKSVVEVNEYIKNSKATKQKELLELLIQNNKMLKKDFSPAVVKTLEEKGLIIITNEQTYRIIPKKGDTKKIVLTELQQKAFEDISFDSYNTYLLHGVTGSGKTEVYIKLIDKAINNNQKALLLVPEISLTTQIINRFYNTFGNDVAIFHSGLSDGEKYDEYLKIFRNEVHVVIGTRSAVFTPITDLGIIIIDEEHSETYKQDSNPRYHAIDMAKYRAEYNNIPLVLGSATPSLETMARAQKGVYKYISIPSRVGKSTLPQIELIDQTPEIKKGNYILSERLKNEIKERLIKNEQTILLLNRRGYSTVISCKACGYTFKCPHCDITLTYHKSTDTLKCHYCGYTIYKKDNCPECHEQALYDYGLGTEKLEQEITKQFPEARVIRMDADTTRNKDSYSNIINSFKNHEADILLGTQMISKGLDFPLVTLVGVINADATLNVPDFRSGERTFQLISQASGRAGRSDKPGQVILQTYNPNNFILKCVQENDYMKFYNYEMNNRHKLDYPPYYYLILLRITSKKYEVASTEITKVKKYLEKKLSKDIIMLGPTVCPVYKLNNTYRFQIILKYKKEDKLLDILKELDEIYMLNKQANLEIDNNPLQV